MPSPAGFRQIVRFGNGQGPGMRRARVNEAPATCQRKSQLTASKVLSGVFGAPVVLFGA